MSNSPEPAAAPFDIQEVALRARLSGIAGRDEADLAALYDGTASRLYALALRMVGNRAGAEEVVADVYCRVWDRADCYDARQEKVIHWLYIVCRSCALDYRRRSEQMRTQYGGGG